MKKFLIAFIISLAFLTHTTCFNTDTTVHSTGYAHHNVIEQTVYRTETGRKYHINSCRYLKYSKIPIEKATAHQAGLTPCKVCKP